VEPNPIKEPASGHTTGQLFTIGYSGWPLEDFLSELARHRIGIICDVRSVPYSRFRPEYSRGLLKDRLNAAGMKYVFFGDALGARPKAREVYVNGQAVYDLIARQEFFQHGLARIRTGVAQHNVTLLCMERDPIECHRAILVCRHLPDIHDRTYHIHRGGHLEPQKELETRLLALHHSLSLPLLQQERSEKNALDEAYAKQGATIAFTEKEPSTSAVGSS